MAASALFPLALPVALPPVVTWALLAGFATCLLRPGWRPLARLILPALLTQAAIHSRLADRLDPEWAGRVLTVRGIVTSIPEQRGDLLEFLFEPSGAAHPSAELPGLLRVRWYRGAPVVQAGEHWELRLRLQPPRSRVNFSGADGERRLFAHGIGALATVNGAGHRRLETHSARGLAYWRQQLRSRLEAGLAEEPALGIILALAIADRSRLTDAQWERLAATGTGHLLAISGLHIGLAAAWGFRAGSLAKLLLPPGWRLAAGMWPAWLTALMLASAYAALAGFGVSTRRALIMLVLLAAARLAGRLLHPLHAWAFALVAVLLLEPLSPLLPGFWLSFGAVAVLLLLFTPRTGASAGPLRLLWAQAGITLVMLPLGMYWFQRATGLGLLANLLAIPWVSLVLVPLLLAGLALMLAGLPAAALWLLRPAAWVADGMDRALAWLAQAGDSGSVVTFQPSLLSVVLACAGGMILLGPRGLPGRWLAAVLVLPLLLPRDPGLSPGDMQLDLLDVGQGLSVLVATPGGLLAYDSGPGLPGEWDLVDAVLVPGIVASGHATPGRVVVSHGDLDHAGGLPGLQQRYPSSRFMVNAGRRLPGSHGCDDRLSWTQDGVLYQALHPSPWLPYLGNLSSCVLSLTSEFHSLLLPGDIDHTVEARLVKQGLRPHAVLVAPHHGSSSSSSEAFLRAVQPALVLVPAGAGNRFGFPHAEVIDRYRASGARVATVSECGALRLRLAPREGPQLVSARRGRAAPWRWPAGPECP
jgi:competence protein ComEC